MHQLGQLASKFGCHIQTHLSETQAEVNWIKELFPWAKSYTEVYDNMRLLGEKVGGGTLAAELRSFSLGVWSVLTPFFTQTILAHCVWLTDEEVFLLRERGAGVSHCPNSNMSVRSGRCNVRRLLSQGLKVGLGSGTSNPSTTKWLLRFSGG